jgi:hypothetical protein
VLIFGVVVFDYHVECGDASRGARLRVEQDALLVRLTGLLALWTKASVATHTVMLAKRICTQLASIYFIFSPNTTIFHLYVIHRIKLGHK